MKATGISFVICLLAAALYFSGMLELFVGRYSAFIAFGLVLGVFLAGIKILGNPFKSKDSD